MSRRGAWGDRDTWGGCPDLKLCRRLSVVMPHSETRMVTGDDNRNTVKENAGQRYSQACTTTPRSWQRSQRPAPVSQNIVDPTDPVLIRNILPRLDAASAAAYTERIRNVTKTVETVTIICSRTFLICRPASVALFVAPE